MLHRIHSGRNVTEKWQDVETKKDLGLPTDANWTIGFNFKKLVALLALPRNLRNTNSFDSSNIIMITGNGTLPSPQVSLTLPSISDVDWAKVANENYGVTIQWKTASSLTWFESFLKNAITFGLGFVPGIGFVLAACFPVAFSCVLDPDNAMSDLRAAVPGVDLQMRLHEKFEEDLIASARESQRYLAPGWEGVKLVKQGSKSKTQPSMAKPVSLNRSEVTMSAEFEQAKAVIE